ncbi:MAG: hypothetical protein AB1644_00665 [Candidatus Zixiibacteriota bacterium]
MIPLVLASAVATLVAQSDQILAYYWNRAHATLKGRDPIETGARFSYVARSFQKKLGKKGEIVSVDSATVAYYYSFGHLDSTTVLRGDPKRLHAVELLFPNIFDSSYVVHGFPNDTGGPSIAIGFDTDSAKHKDPVGLALIDRLTYLPRWAYLYYPNRPGYRRFTRSYRLIAEQGLIFPDSVWEVATKDEFFFSSTYRLETGISQIQIYR